MSVCPKFTSLVPFLICTQKHFQTIITPLYKMVGFDQKAGEEFLMTKLRSSAVSWVCNTGNKDCISRAVGIYAQWMADPDNFS